MTDAVSRGFLKQTIDNLRTVKGHVQQMVEDTLEEYNDLPSVVKVSEGGQQIWTKHENLKIACGEIQNAINTLET